MTVSDTRKTPDAVEERGRVRGPSVRATLVFRTGPGKVFAHSTPSRTSRESSTCDDVRDTRVGHDFTPSVRVRSGVSRVIPTLWTPPVVYPVPPWVLDVGRQGRGVVLDFDLISTVLSGTGTQWLVRPV